MHNHPTPKFSVITVTYNAEAVLEDTIQSVISQTYRHVEYIIVDGASKDKTLSIIDRYKDHIAKVTSEPDKGLYDAMNKGIRLATGDSSASLMQATASTKTIRCSKWYIRCREARCPM